MWFTTSQKNGVSALGLQRVLGLGRDETAWTWTHTLHRAMVRPGRDRLTGEIEVDETYVGGPEEGKRGREIEKKSIVVVAAEKQGWGIGRIRLRRVKDVTTESLRAFIRETADSGATIHTDGWKGYTGLPVAGYKPRVTVISAGVEQAREVMPRVHHVASRLKRWVRGTLQGGVQQQHLGYYLDEFTFRFNRRPLKRTGIALSPPSPTSCCRRSGALWLHCSW
jgi:transposase-like protein